jgi:hypothetical protein
LCTHEDREFGKKDDFKIFNIYISNRVFLLVIGLIIMEFPFNQTEWKEILSKLYKRAAKDHPFHVLCTRDAHAAIKMICGQEIPKNFKIRFEPQQNEEIVLLLPKENKGLSRELSESELDEIATGMSCICAAFAQTLELQNQTNQKIIRET